MSGATSSLLAVLLSVAVPAQAMNHTLRLTHGSDPKSHIAIHVTDSDRGRLYAFRYCETQDETNCIRIGRYESYREAHLQALEANCRTTARIVLWTEVAIITAVVGGILYYGWLHPVFFAEIKNKAGHVSNHARSQSLPPSMLVSRGAEESLSMPELSSIPLEAGRSISPSATPPQLQPLQPEVLPETMGYVAGMIAWGYSWLSGPALGYALAKVQDELLHRFQDVVYLSLRFISPAEHYRAATLLHDITNSDTNLHYTKRDFASMEEYFDQYPVEKLEDLRRKLENLLVVTPH